MYRTQRHIAKPLQVQQQSLTCSSRVAIVIPPPTPSKQGRPPTLSVPPHLSNYPGCLVQSLCSQGSIPPTRHGDQFAGMSECWKASFLNHTAGFPLPPYLFPPPSPLPWWMVLWQRTSSSHTAAPGYCVCQLPDCPRALFSHTLEACLQKKKKKKKILLLAWCSFFKVAAAKTLKSAGSGGCKVSSSQKKNICPVMTFWFRLP